MRLSTSLNVLFEPESITAEAAIRRLAAIGFKTLDFNFVDWLFKDSPFVSDEWEKWVRNIKKTADSLNISFSQAHGPMFNKFEESEKNKWYTLLSHRSLEAAAILGIDWVVFHPETIVGPFDQKHLERMKYKNLEWYDGLLRTAKKTGAGIALENLADVFAHEGYLRRRYCSTPAELIDLVDGFNSPLVGICWDTGHAKLQRLKQDTALAALGSRLKATHIQDNDGLTDQHLLPFYGGVNWRDVIDTLWAINYEGDFTYEIHNFVLKIPDELRDFALKFAYSTGKYLLTDF